MNAAIKFLKAADVCVRKMLRFFTITVFSALAILMLMNVGMRLSNDFTGWLTEIGLPNEAAILKSILPVGSFHWFDEIVELCFASLVFYGAADLWASRKHFSAGDWLSPRLPNERMRAFYRFLKSCVSAAFMVVFFWFSLRLATRSTEYTTVFQIPKSFLYSCMPVSSFIMLVYSAADVCIHAKSIFGKEKVISKE